MMELPVSALWAIVCSCGVAVAAEHDYHKNLRYPPKRDPSIGRDTVDRQGGADAEGYQRRTA